ncbi:MAG: hypothetical protein R2704_09625 [Microthrixaceae bacterium]
MAPTDDECVVLEEAITVGRSELGVPGNESPGCRCPAIVAGADFYDYEDKYLTGAAELVILQRLPRRGRGGPTPGRCGRSGPFGPTPPGPTSSRVARRGLLLNEKSRPHAGVDVPEALGGQRRALHTELIDCCASRWNAAPITGAPPPLTD